MNKFASLLAACSLMLGFTACEDVPAPYQIPTETPENPQTPTPDGPNFIEESFATEFGVFTNFTTSGEGGWKIDFKTAKAAGYDNATKKTKAGTYYLVSKEVDLKGVDAAHIAFDYILRYNKGDQNQQLLITDSFDETKADQNWTVVSQSWTEGQDWKTFSRADLAVPAQFLGKKVRIAFRYNTNDVSGSTWEVKNVLFQKGAPENVTPAPTPTPTPNAPIYSKALTDNAEGWTLEQGELPTGITYVWKQDAQFGLKATAYAGGKRYATKAWAISPAITLTSGNVLTFDHAQRYAADAKTENTLWVREGTTSASPWQQITIPTYPTGADWNFISSGNIDLSNFAGKTVQFGFCYTSTTTAASTWEVKNFVVK